MTKKLLFVGLYLIGMQSNSFAQTSKYFDGAGTWTAANQWSLTSGGTYNQTWVNNDMAIFDVANSSITFATTGVTSIIANENVSFTAAGIMSTNGSLLPITVATAKVLNLNGQVLSSTAGTGIIKNGNGTLDLGNPSSAFPGGFILNSGCVKFGGNNALGIGGALTINGGIITPDIASNIDFTNKFPGGIIIGGNIQFGDNINVSSGTGDMTFTNDVSLGSASRTITIGGIGNYKFSGIISSTNGAELSINNTGNGTLELAGINTYSGATHINAGTVLLSGNASLAASASISLASGTKLDVVGLTASSFKLGLSQALIVSATGSNTTATINVGSHDSVKIVSGGIEFTAFNGGAIAPLSISGSHGTLALFNTPITLHTTSVLSAGTYTLIDKVGNANVKGTVGNISITGSGIASNANASIAAIGGHLILTVAAPNIWTGTTNTSWNIGNNWSLGHVPTSNENIVINSGTVHLNVDYTVPLGSSVNINAGSLIVDALKTLTLNGNCTIAGNLIINGTVDFSDNPVLVSASTTSCGIIDISTGTLLNATNVTVQQWFTAQRAWRMLSTPFTSPLTSEAISIHNSLISVNANGVCDIVQYDGATDNWSIATAIGANTCYAFFYKGLTSDFSGIPGLINYNGVGPTATTYSENGSLNTSAVTITPSIATPSFSLIGNPFAAPVSSSALTGGTSLPYYYYDATDASSGIKIKSGAWIAASTNSSVGTTIPMMGIIAYQAANTSSFSIPKTAINTNGTIVSNKLFKTSAQSQSLELNLYRYNSIHDRIILRKDDQAVANSIDAMDLKKMENSIANLYIISTNQVKLAISTQPAFTQALTIAVYGPEGQYQLKVDVNTFPNSDFVLIDHFTHTQQPLHLGAFYDFTISNDSNSYGSNRFEIAKQTGTNNIATDVLTNNICLLNNVVQDEIKIKILSSEKINYTLVDFKGAIVSKGILYQGDQIIDMFTNASGIYTLALSDQKDRVVYKIIKQ
jgi:autotransporter-associated beta strand protein